jgi:hypothetical protein
MQRQRMAPAPDAQPEQKRITAQPEAASPATWRPVGIGLRTKTFAGLKAGTDSREWMEWVRSRKVARGRDHSQRFQLPDVTELQLNASRVTECNCPSQVRSHSPVAPRPRPRPSVHAGTFGTKAAGCWPRTAPTRSPSPLNPAVCDRIDQRQDVVQHRTRRPGADHGPRERPASVSQVDECHSSAGVDATRVMGCQALWLIRPTSRLSVQTSPI